MPRNPVASRLARLERLALRLAAEADQTRGQLRKRLESTLTRAHALELVTYLINTGRLVLVVLPRVNGCNPRVVYRPAERETPRG